MSLWHERERSGAWPAAGGWLDQPLALIVQMDTIDLAVDTLRYMRSEQADWSKLTALQCDLMRWLESDTDD